MMKLISVEKKNGQEYWEAIVQNSEKIKSCETREDLEELLNTGRKETICLSAEKAIKDLRGKLPAFFGYGLTKKELVSASVDMIFQARKQALAGTQWR